MNIAIIAVAYNRIDTLRNLLQSLTRASYIEETVTLIISVDKSDTDIVEKYAESFVWIHGEKIVAKHDVNLGLRKHMLSLGHYFNTFDALVVLEDDITVSPNFFTYTKQTVEKYYQDDRIGGISLYNFGLNYQTGRPFTPIKDENDVFFMNCAMSWGEVWMKKQWLAFYKWYSTHNDEFQVKPNLPERICQWNNKSWLKYHTRYCIEENKYFVFPYTSLSTNNGAAGEHNANANTLQQVPLQYGQIKEYKLPSLSEKCIRYDGFFENKKLYADNTCIDLNGSKGNRENERYWLSLKSLPYKVVKSYGLEYRPIDANVLLDIQGKDIFLYDTSINAKKPKIHKSIMLYDFRIQSIISFLRQFETKNVIIDIFKTLNYKLKKIHIRNIL